MKFACLHGHTIVAIDWTKSTDGGPTPYVDLSGHFCPVCLGAVISGMEDRDDSRILSPEQEILHEHGRV